MKSETQRIMYDCPFCDEKHEVEVIKEKSSTIIKGKKIKYDRIVYYCEKTNEEFCPSNIMDENLSKARDVYKSVN